MPFYSKMPFLKHILVFQLGPTHGVVDTTSLLSNEITIPSLTDPSFNTLSVRGILAVVIVSIVLLAFVLFVVIIAVKHWRASKRKNAMPLATEEERNACCSGIKYSHCIDYFSSYYCKLRGLLQVDLTLKNNCGDVHIHV